MIKIETSQNPKASVTLLVCLRNWLKLKLRQNSKKLKRVNKHFSSLILIQRPIKKLLRQEPKIKTTQAMQKMNPKSKLENDLLYVNLPHSAISYRIAVETLSGQKLISQIKVNLIKLDF